MKKLKLYGKNRKNDFEGFIAEIYVKDNKVVVKGRDKKVEKELSKEINKLIKEGKSFLLPNPVTTETFHSNGFLAQKIGDPKFLEALYCEFWKYIGLGVPGKLGGKTFGGYRIIPHKSLVVEE